MTEAVNLATLGSNATPTGTLLTSSTAQATTSGTSFDFTGIPSWVQRVTVVLNAISTNGGSQIFIRIGSSVNGIETTGYLGSAVYTGPATLGATHAAGFAISATTGAADIYVGLLTLVKVSGNTWVASSTCGSANGTLYAFIGGGNKTLAGVLDRVRITTVNGTDIFDAGSVNILWE